MVHMDATDTTLVQLLEENSRIPTSELAAMLAVPAPEVEERIRTLQAEGVIRRFTAIVDRGRSGQAEVSAIIELACRNFILRRQGINTAVELEKRMRRSMEGMAE